MVEDPSETLDRISTSGKERSGVCGGVNIHSSGSKKSSDEKAGGYYFFVHAGILA